MSVLTPITHALAGVVAGAHHVLTALGAAPDGGLTWVLSIAAVVVLVRSLLLPIVAHTVRLAHASARARPHMKELAKKYRGKRDPESVRAYAEERRALSTEHGVSRWGCLPMLIQIPVWIGLYHLLAAVARGHAVGVFDSTLVESLRSATLFGVPLSAHGYLGAGNVHLAVVASLALIAASLSYVTQRFLVRPNQVPMDAEDPMAQSMAQTQRMLPWLSAGGLLLTGGVAPVALLIYWVCNSSWTAAQCAVVRRWFPTPGSPAAARREARIRQHPRGGDGLRPAGAPR